MKKALVDEIRTTVIAARETEDALLHNEFEKQLIDAVALTIYLSEEHVTAKGRRTLTANDLTNEERYQALAVLRFISNKLKVKV